MLTELQNRLKSPTPLWFKRIRKVCLITSAVAAALITASATMPGFVIPYPLSIICQWILVGSITATTVASTAKQDTTNA